MSNETQNENLTTAGELHYFEPSPCDYTACCEPVGHEWKAEDSNFMKHAERELDLLLGADNSEDFYNGGIRQAVMELMEVFARQGHSGTSASIVREMFASLSDFKNLTPLTNDPDEWTDHGIGYDGEHTWQNVRNSAAFSHDGGKTYWTLETGREVIYTSTEASE